MKLNIGAGNDIRNGWINHDIAELEGIDIVHDLNKFPWPFEDEQFSEIVANDVLEHLNELIPAMEELHRILKSNGALHIKVPYWNSWGFHADPTHKLSFHEMTFTFFDPDKPYCIERPYYSNARFHIVEECFYLAPFSPYFLIPWVGLIKVRNRFFRRIVGFLGNLFSNIILDLSVTLEKCENKK
jgi:SAM-dependent methyltransferase